MPVYPELLNDLLPKTVLLPSGKYITIRALQPQDKDILSDFFKAIPEDDKLFLKDDLSDPIIAQRWSENLSYNIILPIIALHNNTIVGYASLQQEKRIWRRHLGIVRLTVHPQHRNQNIATTLLQHICELGQYSGLEKLETEFIAEQTEAIHLFQMFGFVKIAVLPQHGLDLKGNYHDFIIMVYNMRDVERFAAD